MLRALASGLLSSLPELSTVGWMTDTRSASVNGNPDEHLFRCDNYRDLTQSPENKGDFCFMVKRDSKVQKVIDKAAKLSTQGKYDASIRELKKVQSEPGVKKIMERTIALRDAVKQVKSNPLHRFFKGKVKVTVARRKKRWWQFWR